MAKKTASKKAGKAAAPNKKPAGPPPVPLRATAKGTGGIIHVQFKDSSEKRIAPAALDIQLYRHFALDEVRVEDDQLVVPCKPITLKFDAKTLAQGNGTHETEIAEFIRRYERVRWTFNNFPKWLDKQLTRRKLKEEEFGKMVGVSNQAINFMRNGKTKPTLSNFFAILRAFNIPIDKL